MRILVLVALAALAVPAIAESEPLFQAEYSNPGLVPAHWTLEIHPDGTVRVVTFTDWILTGAIYRTYAGG